MSNTKTIAKNTGWYGLERLINAILTVCTSIAIARTLGPAKMGYIIYVSWIASMVGELGGLGIPATTRKYMAEFLGMGDRGTARYIFFRTLGLQAALATVVTGGLLVWVLRDAAGDYKLASALIVLSIWPAMVNSIPAQANVAAEEMSKNLPASSISILIYFAMIIATVVFHWGVVGVGASMLLMRLTDFLLRLFPTLTGVLLWETTHVQPVGLGNRMLSFAWQSVAIMIVEMVVWQRSEFILLKHLCADIRQVAFYSVAFSMAECLLISAQIFGSAAGATIFAQYGRDKSRLPSITLPSRRFRFILLPRPSRRRPCLLFMASSTWALQWLLPLPPSSACPRPLSGPYRAFCRATSGRPSLFLRWCSLASSISASPGTSFPRTGRLARASAAARRRSPPSA